jgi:hypothetical protein
MAYCCNDDLDFVLPPPLVHGILFLLCHYRMKIVGFDTMTAKLRRDLFATMSGVAVYDTSLLTITGYDALRYCLDDFAVHTGLVLYFIDKIVSVETGLEENAIPHAKTLDNFFHAANAGSRRQGHDGNIRVFLT